MDILNMALSHQSKVLLKIVDKQFIFINTYQMLLRKYVCISFFFFNEFLPFPPYNHIIIL